MILTQPLTIGSLFSGIGGLELGLERTGQFRTIWNCEIDPYASAVLKKHWPGVPNLGDITKVNWNEIEKPDLICGGFPCQDISIAGKQVGIREGKRSGLWSEYAKAVCVLRPRYILVENVPALATNGLDVVLADLAEMGYNAEWTIVSAASVGALHLRERIFVVAYPNGAGLQTERAELEATRTIECSFLADTQSVHAQRHNQRQGERKSWRSSWWAVEPDVGRVAYGVPNRVDRLKCLGNAVVPQVAQKIGEMIIGASP